MQFSKGFLNFNREVLLGQLGGFIGIQLAAYVTPKFSSSPETISFMIVVGSIIIGSLFWAAIKIYDKTRGKKTYTPKKFLHDIELFTPAAFVLSLMFYYPPLYYLSKFLIKPSISANISAAISQTIAAVLFFISINIYRKVLYKDFKEKM